MSLDHQCVRDNNSLLVGRPRTPTPPVTSSRTKPSVALAPAAVPGMSSVVFMCGCLTSDLSDHHGLMWRLGAIERRQASERIVVLGRVTPECERPLGGSQLGRQTGAPLTPRLRGRACFRGSSGFRGPSRDGSVSVEIVRASPGEQHVQIWMTHEPRIGPCGVSCLRLERSLE